MRGSYCVIDELMLFFLSDWISGSGNQELDAIISLLSPNVCRRRNRGPFTYIGDDDFMFLARDSPWVECHLGFLRPFLKMWLSVANWCLYGYTPWMTVFLLFSTSTPAALLTSWIIEIPSACHVSLFVEATTNDLADHGADREKDDIAYIGSPCLGGHFRTFM
jgi:hypothetical protein